METTATTPAQQLNALLPPALQPGSSRVMGDELTRLLDGGWTVEAVHQSVMADVGPHAGPGIVIHILRGLPDTPPENYIPTPTPRHRGHKPCPDGHTGMHGQPCELCWCDSGRGPVHHVRTDPWIGWPDLNLIPDDYGPGWLRNTPTPSPTTDAPW